MFKRLMVLLFIVLGLNQVNAQEETPAYALAFRVDNEVLVATFYEASGWEIQTLPNFMLFGQYDISLVLPVWTANGRLLRTGYAPEVGAQENPETLLPAAHLYRYDLPGETMSIMPQAIEEQSNPDLYLPPTLAISSVSPDGRYATLYDLIATKGYLVDFESQQVPVRLDTCGLKAFHWTDSSVFLGSFSAYIACPPAFFEADLTSGATLIDMREALAGQDVTVIDTGRWLGDADFLVTAYGLESYYNLVRINPTEATVLAPFDFVPPIVSESGQYAAYYAASGLVMIDLNTMETVDLDVPNLNTPPYFEGETLHYGALLQAENGTQYVHGQYHPETRQQTTLLYAPDGVEVLEYNFSPSYQAVAITTATGLEVYGEAGLISDQLPLSPEAEASYLAWADDGNMLYLYANSGTTALNLQTAEIIAPPEPYAVFLSTSPDGRWWLYIVREPGDSDGMYQSERLFVYDSQTQEIVVLSNEGGLYDNFHWALDSLFVWSPMFE